MSKPHLRMGPIAKNLCWLFDGVVVGSCINYLRGLTDAVPKDIDIIIPLDRWIKASKLIPIGAKANSFGGFKFRDGRIVVDVWADDVVRVMYTSGTKEALIPKTGQVIRLG